MRVFHRDVHAFRVFGATGFVAAGVTALGVAPLLGVSMSTVGVMFVLAIATYLALAALATVVSGEPVLVFYQHAVAVALVLLVALASRNQPLLAPLDVYAVSVVAFLAVARLGCLTVGCCHGRPHEPRTPLGAITYGEAHAEDGFPHHLVGVPLFPVQALEATGAALLTVASVTWAAIAEPRPGDVLGFVVVGYALLRYRLEGLRGDPGRAELRQLTVARLTSIALTVLVVGGAAAGLLPWQAFYPVAAALLVVVAGGRAMSAPRPWDPEVLLHPDHVAELATLLAVADDRTTPEHIAVVETSAGLRVSTTSLAFDGAMSHGTVVTLSAAHGETLPELAAFAVGRLLTTMRQPDGGAALHTGGSGAFHVVLYDRAEGPVSAPVAVAPTRRASEEPRVGLEAEEQLAEGLVEFRGDHQVLRRDVHVPEAALEDVGLVDARATGEGVRGVRGGDGGPGRVHARQPDAHPRR
jgi:hypothetical protein